MKFLEINKFAQLTAQLTEANICERVINGRIEAFTMKRAGTDNKYAHALGEKYQHEIQVEETEMNNLKKNISIQRNRSGSVAGNSIDSTGTGGGSARSASGSCNSSVSGKKRSNSTSSLGMDGSGSSRKRNGKSSSSVSRRRPSPKSKRVRIVTDPTNTGRRRSSSLSSVPASSPSLGVGLTLPMASAMRSRSDSFNASHGHGKGHNKGHNNMNITTPNLNFPYSNSPLGDFHETCTQRLMIDLILTLNSSFPDYDFSTIRPQHFAKVPSTRIAMNRTNEKLSELAASTPQGATFLPHLYSSIDEVIHLSECEVYSYVPPSRDDDDDPLSFLTQTLDGMESSVPLWSFNFFFVNKSLKRIVLLTCVQTMRTEMAEMEMEEMGMGMEEDQDQYQLDEQDSSGMGMGIHGGGGSHGLYGASSQDGLENDQFGTPGREATPSNHSRSMSYNVVEEDDGEEEEGGLDFDMDADAMNQAVAPPATVA